MDVIYEQLQAQANQKGIFEPESPSDKGGQVGQEEVFAPIKEEPEEQLVQENPKPKVIKKRPNY